ncbi:hypothetical protein [Pararhodobacter sp. CCB-MM2]|uniref:hypothetical protein n=1 Tax=Pararhodobacter sp. CCB-MM2 TaxID=1786003 RepID=UPI00082D08B0|nr:hypothetical protein [Pararhodobacter sp. CCB-MM2]
MSSDRSLKGLVFDEADFDLPRDCDFEMLTETVRSYCEEVLLQDIFAEDLEVSGIAAEGFGDAVAYFEPERSCYWLCANTGFRELFLQQFSKYEVPEELAASVLATGSTLDVESHLWDRIKTRVDDRDIGGVDSLLSLLPGLRSSGLLGVTEQGQLQMGSDFFTIADLRPNDYGPGRRIFVEATIWWGRDI